jgi:3-hydroxyacyl-CoA dehydrogenase
MAYAGDVKTIGVVGAGQMGAGIAQVAAGAGFDVMLVDATVLLAERGRDKMAAMLDKQVAKTKMTREARDAVLARVHVGDGTASLEGCDFAVEAATEKLELKLALLRGCDSALPARATRRASRSRAWRRKPRGPTASSACTS